ncbi:hypothetical protein KAX02_00405 [candidate division WOR-3 bacterium]|nr:hypothetical protein [candidate division WOR-3 bacterium]
MFMLAGSVPEENVRDYFYIVKVAVTELHIHKLYAHFKAGKLDQFLDKELSLSGLGDA